jgi:hypothetical protein
MYLKYGQIRVISTNSSDNVCYFSSSFRFDAKTNSAYSSQLNYSTEDCYMHYCYVMNNYADYRSCLRLTYCKQTCEECNIINNSQSTNSSGTFYCDGNPTITINKCCLIKNNAIGSGEYLFNRGNGAMEVRECTIQSGYKVHGTVTTSYSNIEINLEKGTEGLKFCAANVIIYNQLKCKCSVYDNMLINNLNRLYLNKQFYYK